MSGATMPSSPRDGRGAHDIHDGRQIVGEHVQRHLGGDSWRRLHQEVGCAHPASTVPKGVLDGLAPLAHFFRMLIEPALHRLKNVLILPSGDPTFLAVVHICLMAQLWQRWSNSDVGPIRFLRS